jgi:hypothetical protein
MDRLRTIESKLKKTEKEASKHETDSDDTTESRPKKPQPKNTLLRLEDRLIRSFCSVFTQDALIEDRLELWLGA